MIQVNSLEEIVKEIESKKAIILYFSSKNCAVCSVLKPKIEQKVYETFEKIEMYEIKSDDLPLVTSHFGVFNAPTIIFYLDGKEFFKEGRNISINQFIEKIKRPYKLYYGE